MFSFSIDEQSYHQIIALEYGRSVEKVCRYCVIDFYDQSLAQAKQVPYHSNSIFRLFYNKKLLMTGRIDRFSYAKSVSKESFQISCRSLLCDIVDSSVTKYVLRDTKILDLVKRLVRGFNAKVKVTNLAKAGQVVKRATFSVGEKIIKAVAKQCSFYQIRLTDNEEGELVLSDEKYPTVGEITTNEIESIEYLKKETALFSDYYGYNSGKKKLIGKAADRSIRPRFLAYQLSGVNQQKDLDDFVRYDMEIKKSQSEVITISDLNKLESSTGVPYDINQLVFLRMENYFNINELFLITGITVKYDLSGGMKASLTLKKKDAYDLASKKGILNAQ